MSARQRGSSIQRVELKNGEVRWRFRIDLGPGPNGKRRQRTLTFRTEAEAIDEQAKLRTDVREGSYIEPSRVTVTGWLDTWREMNARTWTPTTRASYRNTLTPVLKLIGTMRLQDLRREHVETMVRKLSTTSLRTGKTSRSPRSVAYALQLVKTAMKAAVAEEIIKRNPAEHVKPPKQPAHEMQTWTAAELRAFLRHLADDDLAGAWHLTALGLRRGEVLGLRWGDVDLDGAVIHIRQARVPAAREGGVVTVEPKTKRGRRDVPLHPHAVAALRQTRQRTLLDSTSIPFAAKRDPNRLVAVDAAGNPFEPSMWGHFFQAHSAAAGVRRIRLHDVRHTAATLMLQEGVPPVIVAGILGHSPAVLLTTYAHALPDAKRAAVETLGGLYATGS